MDPQTYVRARARAGARLFSVTAALLALGVFSAGVSSCAGASEPRAPEHPGTASTAALAAPQIAAITAPSEPTDLPGGAERPAEPTNPADLVPLTARFAPRDLDIPAVRAGRTARFTFDGHRRGWFARLPDSRQNPLTPVYGGGRVMVGGGFTSHTFYAFDARTGHLDWRAAAPDGGPTAAIVEDGKVLFNTESCTLFAVDARTGRQRWSFYLGDPLMGQPAAANGRVFSGHIRNDGSSGYGFTAMDLDNGRVLWTKNMPADVLNAPVLDDTDVYFTTMDGSVWRLDQRSGRIVWRRRLDATSAPWLHGETVHVTRRDRRQSEDGARSVLEVATVLAQADGATVREHDGAPAQFLPRRPDTGGTLAGWEFEGSRPTIVDGRAYQTIGNEVQSRDAETGDLLWRRQYTQATRSRPASSPAIAGSQMIFGTRDGVLYGLDIDTGMTAWAYDVGEPIAAQPTVAHGWVYATTTRGGLVALEVSDDALDGWHMWGGNARHSGPVVGDVAPPEEDERPSEGALRLEGRARSGEIAGFPLAGTNVTARVSGFVTRVTVEQEFTNPYERAVEATYLFPLPENAAVDAMEMRIGTRVVRADIRRRHEAREAYDDARHRGVLASLLEQERPNLFRQSVANVRPGDTVRIVLSYTQALPYEEGSYRFVYPMVAGPRYQPQAPDASHAAAGAEPIAQVVLPPGAERPDRVRVSIEADLGVAISEISSPTHAIDVVRTDNQAARVTLRSVDGAAGVRPDRDLDVRFRVAGAAPTVSTITSAPEAGEPGHLALSIQPRLDVPAGELTPRELVFVVDTSSSMHGRPIELARAAMITALRGMRPTDTFRVLGFSDTVHALSDVALDATPENVARGEAFVRDLDALGATEMIAGLRAALEPAAQADRMRIVLLMTDGFIGNETDVFRAVHDHLGAARVFAFGVGSAVNRYLLTRVAEEGRGDAQVVTLGENPEHAAEEFHARIARPYLTDVTIDWGGLDVSGAYPRRLPDLFADRPLRVHARYGRAGSGEVVIRGRVAGRPFEQRVAIELPAAGATARAELGSIWARTRIGDLMTALELQPSPTLQEEVTQLGLRHHLLTPWTAFVAIDEGYHADGEAMRVEEPSQLPAGVTGPSVAVPAEVQARSTPMRGARTRISPPVRAMSMPSTATGTTAAIGGGGGGDDRRMDFDAPMERALGGTIGMGQPIVDPRPEPPREPTASPDPGTPELRQGREGASVGRRPRQPAGGRGGGASQCYEMARRADGTIDEEALARCLAGLGGGGGEPIDQPSSGSEKKLRWCGCSSR